MSVEEAVIFALFRKRAQKGQIVEVKEIKAASCPEAGTPRKASTRRWRPPKIKSLVEELKVIHSGKEAKLWIVSAIQSAPSQIRSFPASLAGNG